jgi:hypothetical protein
MTNSPVSKLRVTRWSIAAGAFALLLSAGSYIALAQAPAGGAPAAPAAPQLQPQSERAPQKPSPRMSFFVTSVGMGDGANLGGLSGADRHCQALAETVGAGGKTWHAYLSTQASTSQPAVNARDRIGSGPWYNFAGTLVGNGLADLHGDTLELARLGNRLTRNNVMTERGTYIPGTAFNEAPPNQHDALTGTQPDGRAFTDAMDHTCSNWTSDADGKGTAMLGHLDRNGANFMSWNAAHPSNGCSQANLVSTGGAGLFYCFAIN